MHCAQRNMHLHATCLKTRATKKNLKKNWGNLQKTVGLPETKKFFSVALTVWCTKLLLTECCSLKMINYVVYIKDLDL